MLEVSVTNLWPNRLIGDEHFPADYEYSVVNASTPGRIAAIPDWFREGKPMPAGKRVAFAPWKHFGADTPMLESGLLGPVPLLTAKPYPPACPPAGGRPLPGLGARHPSPAHHVGPFVAHRSQNR